MISFLRSLLPTGIRSLLLTGKSLVSRSVGLDIVGYDISHPKYRLQEIFKQYGIDTVIDAGANTGQFARHLRRAGFKGDIHSIEPLQNEFKALSHAARKDQRWHCYNYAVGAESATTTINVSNFSASSSLLPMADAHRQAEHSINYVGTEVVEVRTLDSLFADSSRFARNVFLKMDVQGFEYEVLRGAPELLKRLLFVQAELSFVTLYEGEKTFIDFVQFMGSQGFRIISIEQGFIDNHTLFGLQSDVIFYRG